MLVGAHHGELVVGEGREVEDVGVAAAQDLVGRPELRRSGKQVRFVSRGGRSGEGSDEVERDEVGDEREGETHETLTAL